MPKKTFTEEDKGRRTRVFMGTHAGRIGWVHLTANKFSKKLWLILEATDECPQKAALVDKDHVSFSVVEDHNVTNDSHALLKEVPELQNVLDAFVHKLVECDIFESLPRDMHDVIAWKFNMAKEQRDSNSVVTTRITSIRKKTRKARSNRKSGSANLIRDDNDDDDMNDSI